MERGQIICKFVSYASDTKETVTVTT